MLLNSDGPLFSFSLFLPTIINQVRLNLPASLPRFSLWLEYVARYTTLVLGSSND